VAAPGKDVLTKHVAVLVALSALLVGCGAKQSSNAVSESADKTSAAGSSHFAISYGGKLFMTGAFDYDEGIGVLDSRGGLPEMLFTKDGSFIKPAPDGIRDVLDVYGAVLEGSGKQWIQQPGATHSFGFAPPFVGDPNDLLRLLRGAIDVERTDIGVERGVKVSRYNARLDVDRALAELPEDERGSVRASIRQYWTEGAKDGIRLELSVDAEDRLRSLSFDVPDGERVLIEFFEYGVEPGVATPPKDEVMSNDEFIARAKSLCTDYHRDQSVTAACLVGTMLEEK
jgi:hypothetical protein